MAPASADLTESLKSEAQQLGFALVGVCQAAPPDGLGRFLQWLDRGFAGEMHYLSQRKEAYKHPQHVLAGVQSIVMLATPYLSSSPKIPVNGQGRISRYAWSGHDYHDIIHQRMERLIDFLHTCEPRAIARAVVDTAPLLERDFAVRCGLGWQGKNTLLLNPRHGSWFFLSALLTDAQLAVDEPFAADHCGTCRACLDACPTQAFVEPGVLNATKCISYLTIEHRTAIPREQRSAIGDWVFGCDVCQDVCPWNGKVAPSRDPLFAADAAMDPLNLRELFFLSDEEFRSRFRATPLWRPRRKGILRNAAIVLGNQRDSTAIEALSHGLSDAEPLVRGACAWALGQIGGDSARGQLRQRLNLETDAEVRNEIEVALE